MARLPKVGDDKGTWGGILNDFLEQSHDSDGTLKADTVGPVQLKPNAVTSAAIANSSVTAAKIADGAVGTAQLADTSVNTQKLAGLGEADGVASLDGDGRLPEAQVPERLSESELSSAFAGKGGTRLGLIGDSITNQNYSLYAASPGGTVASAGGYMAHANVLLRHRFSIIYPEPIQHGTNTDAEWGESGETAWSILQSDAASAAASVADVFVEAAGTNDLTALDHNTGEEIASTKRAIWEVLLAGGKQVVTGELLPRSSATSTSAHRELRKANRLIRKYAQEMPGVTLVPWHDALVGNDGYIDPDTTGDGIHPNAVGAARMGHVLARVLETITPYAESELGTSTADEAELHPNPTMLGTSGTKGAGTTGDLASYLNSYVMGAGTAVLSKVQRTDAYPGEWQQVSVTAANRNNDGANILVQNQAVGDEWNVGDVVYAAVEFETDSDWDAVDLSLEVANFGGTYACYDLFNGGTTTRQAIPTALPRPNSGVLRVIPFVIPPNTTRLQVRVAQYGSGTFRIGRSTLRKEI